MLTIGLAECAHLTITVSEIQRYIGRKSSFFHTPLCSTPPLGEFPSEHRHPVWYGKSRMAWLPDGGKISSITLFVLAQLTNVTDGQTDRHRVTAIAALCIASHGKNWRFPTNIQLCFENNIRYGHSYNGRRIGTRMRSSALAALCDYALYKSTSTFTLGLHYTKWRHFQ